MLSARVLAATVLLAVPSVLTAQSFTPEQSLSGTTMTFTQFASSLGVLKKVHINLDIAYTFQVTATATQVSEELGASFDWDADAEVEVYSPDFTLIGLDYKNVGGGLYFSRQGESKTSQRTAQLTPAITLTDSNLLTQFMGAGSAALQLDLYPYPPFAYWIDGAGTFGWSSSLASATGRLRYEYEPTAVPEPASFALVTAGLVGLGVVARRRRTA